MDRYTDYYTRWKNGYEETISGRGGNTPYGQTRSPPVDYGRTRTGPNYGTTIAPDYGMTRPGPEYGTTIAPDYGMTRPEPSVRTGRLSEEDWFNHATYAGDGPPLDYTIVPKLDQTPRSQQMVDRDKDRSHYPGKYRPPPRRDSFSSRQHHSDYQGMSDNLNGHRSANGDAPDRNGKSMNGKPYTSSEKPYMISSDDGLFSKPRKTERIDSFSQNYFLSNNKHRFYFLFMRFIVLLLIIWDMTNDWLIIALGPSAFINNTLSCTNKYSFMDKFNVDNSTIDFSICTDKGRFYTSLSVFVIVASTITVVQCINVLLEIANFLVKIKMPHMRGQTEVFLAIFIEEIPQEFLTAVLLVTCTCHSNRLPFEIFPLLASISAALGTTFRFVTCFPSVTKDDGCCNVWWRCCCCQDDEYCCKIKPRDFFCKWEIPFPFFCCTLRCDTGTCHGVTWCSSLLKRLNCYCTCCRDDDVDYGIRLVNILGLLILWLFVILQIIIISV